MKQTFSLLLAVTLFSLTFKSYSQEVNITTATIERAIYIQESDTEGHWEPEGPPTEYISLFRMSGAHTTITHITDDRKSVYFINDYVYNEDKNRLELEVTSDNGNNYTGIIDDVNQNIRFIFEDGDLLRLVKYTFKKVWKSNSENRSW